MKAEMDAKGVLTIRAENGLEAFALKTWWDLFNQKRTVLGVDFDSAEAEEDTLVHVIKSSRTP